MPGQDSMRLNSMSRIMARICLAAILLVPVSHALIWAGIIPIRDVLGLADAMTIIRSPQTGPRTLLLGFVITMVPQLALLWGLNHLRQLFEGMAGGEVFGPNAAMHVRRFAFALLLYAILDFLMEAPLAALVSWNNPPGERYVSFSFGWNDLHTWFIIAIFFVFTQIISEGIRLQRENADFV